MDEKKGGFQKTLEIGLILAALVFGGVVELRGALLKYRHTDASVYFRAGWAARTGEDLYLTTDDHGWHFFYPPITAIAFGPLADAPAGASRACMLPYAVTVGVWYGISVVLIVMGVHRLAVELKKAMPGIALPVWRLRDGVIVACLPVMARSLVRGQVGPIWLALLCAMLIAMMRGRAVRAGVWLAGAICLKVIPLFLVIEPLWRRNWRMLMGCAAGLVLGILVIPSLVMGTGRAMETNKEYVKLVLWPGLTGRNLQGSSAMELADSVTFDTQNYREIIKHTIEKIGGEDTAKRSAAWIGAAHWTIAGALAVITLWAAARQKRPDAAGILLTMGGLIIVMLGAAPVCHAHYFMLEAPLMMGLCACLGAGKPRGWLQWGTHLAIWANPVAHILTVLPHLEVLRDLGLVLYAALALWGMGIAHLVARARPMESGMGEQEEKDTPAVVEHLAA